MMRIGLLSDTHSYLDSKVLDNFEECDEIWHAGDIGDPSVLDQLEEAKPVRAVYGNIDDQQIRSRAPLNQSFTLEGVTVFMTHIGGYPGRYTARVRAILDAEQPRLYVCGHSHILKVMMDKQRQCLHLNPGACGRHGFHQIRTLLRFSLAAGRVENMEIIELGKR